MRKLVSMFVVLLVVLTFIPLSPLANNHIKVFIHGNELQSIDQPPILREDSVFLPLRPIVEALGSSVEWEQETSTVTIYNDEIEIIFQVNSQTATVNGKQKEIPPSFITNSRTMVPVRFITENFGLFVQWNGENRHVYITESRRIPVILSEQERKIAEHLLKDEYRMERIEATIAEGMTFLGTPYKYGAQVGDTTAFDCSSFVAYLFEQQKMVMPRVASDQANVGFKIPYEDIARGDLLFFDTALNGNIEHVGIYLGNNEMLHVSTSRGVQVTQLHDYWQERYVVATRY